MKKIERKVQDERVVVEYEANDGTVFYNSVECENYEKTYVCAIKARLKQIALKVGTEEEIMGGAGSCETTVYVVQPKSDADIFVIQQALSINNSNNAERVDDNDIGHVLLVGFTYGDDYAFLVNLDALITCMTNGKWSVVENK